MKCVRKYSTGGQYKLYEGKPKKKGATQQERKDYAIQKAEKEREKLRKKAARKGRKSERRGEEPIGFRTVFTGGGNPRFLQESSQEQVPVYEDEYNLLKEAAQVDPVDYYPAVGKSGVVTGGNYGSVCKPGSKGAGANVACDPGKARKLGKRREAKGVTFLDKLMHAIRGKAYGRGVNRQAPSNRYNPFSDSERAAIAAEQGLPIRGITLNQAPAIDFSLDPRFQ